MIAVGSSNLEKGETVSEATPQSASADIVSYLLCRHGINVADTVPGAALRYQGIFTATV